MKCWYNGFGDVMKEKLYTIPVNEVFSEECFCPFCKLYKRLEAEEIRYAVGPAMMEPDYRAVTNKMGFCRKHMQELDSLPKALALSLVMESHFKEIKETLSSPFMPAKKKLFDKKGPSEPDFHIEKVASLNKGCAICDKVNRHFLRYVDTFIYMVKEDSEFLNKVASKDGFCMPHYEDVLRAAREKLSDKDFSRIIEKINEAQIKKFEKYEKDIKDFIESFDYHNAGKPCKAPADTVVKSGWFLNGEFERLSKKLEDV